MKKFLRFMLLVALMVPLGARATTDTLTVANGTVSNENIPIYGYWADAPQHNQIIYPASMLDTMIGQNIIGLYFYVTGGWSVPSAVVSLAVVPDSTLSGLITNASLTQVWSGPLSGAMQIDFANAFVYTGGNLLVDIQTSAGSYSNSTAMGITRNGASYRTYNSNGSAQNFLPKADFIYSNEAFCYAPSSLTMDTATTGSLTFHWTRGGTETAWDVMVGDSLISDVVDTFITVDNIAASMLYTVKVRAVCDVENRSSWISTTMQTFCASVSVLPWGTGFEQADDFTVPLCWTRTVDLYSVDPYSDDTTFSPSTYNYSYYAHNGSAVLAFLYTDYYDMGLPTDGLISSPFIAHNPSDLHVTFWVNPSDMNGSTLLAGVITDPTDATTFIPLLTISENNFTDYDYQQFEFFTSSLTQFSDGDSICIAFKSTATNAPYYFGIYIDDLLVDAMGTCLAPTLNSGNVDSISYEAAQLSWSVDADADEFSVKLVTVPGGTTSYYTANDTTILIQNLNPNTTYSAYAASICGGDTTDYTFLGTFTTHLRCYSVVNPACGALTSNAAGLTWGFTGTGIEPTSVEITLTDLTDSNASPLTVVVTDATVYTFSGLTEGHLYQAVFYTYCGSDDTSASVSVNFMPHAQPCAEVAGTGINSYVPMYSLYNNSFSESLYDADIIAGVDTISGISLQIAQTLNRNNVLDIYMGYTTLNAISGNSATSYVPVSQLTHVVSNYNFNSSTEGWLDMIPFDTLFVTQPTGDSLNLVIAFYNHTGSWQSGLRWATHTSPIGTSAYCYTDDNLNLLTPWVASNSTTNDAPNIQLYGSCGGGDCLPPSLTVSASDTVSVTLVWLPGASESSWTIQYRLNGATAWTTAGTALMQPYVISGLSAGTEYQFRIGAECGDTVVYSTAVTGTTACGWLHAPASIIPTGENPCWTYNGSYSFYNGEFSFYYGSTIISPAIADSINTLQVKVHGYGANYYVGVCDGTTTNVTWIDTASFSTEYGIYEYHKTYLNSYTGTGNHIIIKSSNNYNTTYMDNITIEPLDNCMPVSNLALDSVTPTEAWLSWSSNGTNFEVRYIAESDTTGTWASVTTTDTTAHLTGLNSNDHYQIKVFTVCSATERSDSVTLRIASGCLPYAVPFNEQFGLDELPVCWNAHTYGSVYSGYSWEGVAADGYDYIASIAGYSNNAANDWVMTPMIQLPADASNYMLIYAYGGGPDSYTTGSTCSYEVLVSTSGNTDTASYTRIFIDSTLNTMVNYDVELFYKRLPLAAYGGQAVSFAFRNNSTREGTVYIADVSVREAVEPIYYVNGPSSLFTGDTGYFYALYQEGVLDSMTLSWTSTMAARGQAVMTGANTDSMSMVYSVEGIDTVTFIASNAYGADTNRLVVYVYDCTPVVNFPFHESFETEEAPVGCWTLVYGDNNPSLNPMIHSTEIGSGLSAIPDGSRVFRFSSMATSSDYNQYLISRELAGTNMTLSFKYAKYNTFGIENLRVGYSSTSRDTNDFTWRPWLADSLSSTDWKTYTESIPEGTKYIAFQYWGDYAYYVYIDDVIITGTSSVCETPVLNPAANPAETTVTFSWLSSASSYEVAIVEGTWVAPASGTLVSDTAYTFTGLTAGTQYALGVRAVCGTDNYSDWAVTSVTTAEHPCLAPTAVTVTGVTINGATVNWTAAEATQTHFQIRYSAAADTTIVDVTTNPYTLTGLLSNTEYSVAVRAVCGEGSYSDWTVAQPFTTTVCQPVSDVTVGELSQTTATISWTAGSNSNGNYEVAYGIIGTSVPNATHQIVEGSTSYTITGLEEGTGYVVYVRSICAEGVQSDWTSGTTFTTEDEIGITDVDNARISLYPNPASSTVTLTGIEGAAKVTVVDMNGREVYSGNTADGRLTIDVSGMSQGAYFVRITGEQVNAIRKLIVR